MKDKLLIGKLIQALRQDMETFPDHRRGHNRQYEVADAGMAALSQTWECVFREMEASGLLDQYRDGKDQLLIAIDGTEYFCSQQIHCQHCSHRECANGKTEYFHSVPTPVIVHHEQSHVIALEPEFICPQDGHEKQDCEINAAKRWLKKHSETIRRHNIVLLGDDLYSREPFCRETMGTTTFIWSIKAYIQQFY